MKSFTHMSCQSIETVFSSSKTRPAYLQLRQGTACKLLISYPLDWPSRPRSISDWPPFYILDRRVHDGIFSKLPHFPNLNTSWLEKDYVFHKGWVTTPSMRKRLIECIHKCCGNTRYDLPYSYVIITCSCLYLFSTKPVNWRGLLSIIMSIHFTLCF